MQTKKFGTPVLKAAAMDTVFSGMTRWSLV